MFTIHNGQVDVLSGRLTSDVSLRAAGTLRNESEVYTRRFASIGVLFGAGTLRTHCKSKPLGGLIDPLQTVMFYGCPVPILVQLVSGGIVVIEPTEYADVQPGILKNPLPTP